MIRDNCPYIACVPGAASDQSGLPTDHYKLLYVVDACSIAVHSNWNLEVPIVGLRRGSFRK
jgi:hypothetical protein